MMYQKRKYVWTQEEQIHLKNLKKQRKQESWKKISQQMNLRFKGCSKTPKQCRQKYANYPRFHGPQGEQNNSSWTSQDDKKLIDLYNKFGSAWSKFTNTLIGKSQNGIKNRFYNKLKKLSNKIDNHRFSHGQENRQTITYKSFIRILDFFNQLREMSQNSKMELNTQNVVFKARNQILFCSFSENPQIQINCQQLCSIYKKIKQINLKIRSFGICKNSKKKKWKLSNSSIDPSIYYVAKNEPQGQKQAETINQISETKKDALQPIHNIQNTKMFPYYPFFLMHPLNCWLSPSINAFNYGQDYIKIQEPEQNYKIIESAKIKIQPQQN